MFEITTTITFKIAVDEAATYRDKFVSEAGKAEQTAKRKIESFLGQVEYENTIVREIKTED